jgi:hypothetical protein
MMIIILATKQMYLQNTDEIQKKDTTTIFIHTTNNIKHLINYEDNKDMITCPITGDIIKDPIKLNYHYYEKESLLFWLSKKNTDPLTNLPIKENDLNSFVTHKFIYRKYFKDKNQYSFEIEQIIVNYDKNLLRFIIKDDKKMMNVFFNQILSYKLSGIANFCSLSISVKSTINNQDIHICITPCDVSRTLCDLLDDIFKV